MTGHVPHGNQGAIGAQRALGDLRQVLAWTSKELVENAVAMARQWGNLLQESQKQNLWDTSRLKDLNLNATSCSKFAIQIFGILQTFVDFFGPA